MLSRAITLAAVAAGGYYVFHQMSKRRRGELFSSAEQSVTVNVPVRTAYNQWTQFEDFPAFMKNVHEVSQIDDTHLRWRATVGGREKAWEVETTEQIPDKRIAWRGIGGVGNAGVVTFHRISEHETRIMLQLDYEPHGVVEKVGDTFGVVKLQARADLKRFKQMLESRGSETGAWRGAVSQDSEKPAVGPLQ